jgi:hypothetical protein
LIKGRVEKPTLNKVSLLKTDEIFVATVTTLLNLDLEALDSVKGKEKNEN